jgi:hypothetical protein
MNVIGIAKTAISKANVTASVEGSTLRVSQITGSCDK